MSGDIVIGKRGVLCRIVVVSRGSKFCFEL